MGVPAHGHGYCRHGYTGMMWESLPSWLHRYDVGVLPSWLHRYDVGVPAVMVTQV